MKSGSFFVRFLLNLDLVLSLIESPILLNPLTYEENNFMP